MRPLHAASASRIRAELYRTRLHRHLVSPTSIVIDELGLAHARSRIDVAVLNGSLHGYEIKSAADSLRRLPNQLAVYQQTLHKLTLVSATTHVPTLLATLPAWCGLIRVTHGPRGGVTLRKIRPPAVNPDASPFMLAHLLWRQEAHDLLVQRGFAPKRARERRHALYAMLCDILTPEELVVAIREAMVRRPDWRDRSLP